MYLMTSLYAAYVLIGSVPCPSSNTVFCSYLHPRPASGLNVTAAALCGAVATAVAGALQAGAADHQCKSGTDSARS